MLLELQFGQKVNHDKLSSNFEKLDEKSDESRENTTTVNDSEEQYQEKKENCDSINSETRTGSKCENEKHKSDDKIAYKENANDNHKNPIKEEKEQEQEKVKETSATTTKTANVNNVKMILLPMDLLKILSKRKYENKFDCIIVGTFYIHMVGNILFKSLNKSSKVSPLVVIESPKLSDTNHIHIFVLTINNGSCSELIA